MIYVLNWLKPRIDLHSTETLTWLKPRIPWHSREILLWLKPKKWFTYQRSHFLFWLAETWAVHFLVWAFFFAFRASIFLRISHRAKRSISSTISNERWDKQICLESEHPLEKESSRLCWNRNFWFINALTALIRSQILDGSKSNIDLMTWGFAPPLI